MDARARLGDHERMRLSRLVPFASLLATGAGCTSLLGDFSQATGSGDGGPQSDSSLDGTTSDAADSGAGETGTPESGTNEGGSGEAGGAGDAGEGGSPTPTCALVGSLERVVTGADGGTISADNLFVYYASMTNVLALVKTGSPPSLAYAFRSDRPGDAPQALQLQNQGSNANLMSSARSVDGTSTYALASDPNGNLVVFDWPDGTGLDSTPAYTHAEPSGVQYQTSKMVPKSAGLFFASAVQAHGLFVDLEDPSAAPQFLASTQISTTVDTGISDGQRAYRMSNDGVSLFYYGSDATMHQDIYPAGSVTPTSSRQFSTGTALPVSLLADGTNVDVAVVQPLGDAGNAYGVFTGVVPESQLGTFALSSLKQVPFTGGITTQPCIAAYPGGLALGFPALAGLDFYLIDVATGAITTALVGAANLLHSDTAIVTCALASVPGTPGAVDFDLIWTDNVGGGAQSLSFAPIDCTP